MGEFVSKFSKRRHVRTYSAKTVRVEGATASEQPDDDSLDSTAASHHDGPTTTTTSSPFSYSCQLIAECITQA